MTPSKYTVLLALLWANLAQAFESNSMAPGTGDSAADETRAFDVNAVLPRGNENLTAMRVDSEVFGWNKEYTEMASVILEVYRDPRGAQSGEVAVVVFPIGSTVPVYNIHMIDVSQNARPHNPGALDTVTDLAWAAGDGSQKMWPQKPIHRRPKNGMQILPLWEYTPIGDGICSPSVGFMLRMNGVVRYQPHILITMKSACEYLKYIGARIYWAKADLGAIMIRFDYTPNEENEHSFRYPLSVAWKNALPVHMQLRTSMPINHPQVKKIRSRFEQFGKVTTILDPNANSRMIRFKQHAGLAREIAKILEIPHTEEISEKSGSWDIELVFAPEGAAPKPSTKEAPENKALPDKKPEPKSNYLNDWKP